MIYTDIKRRSPIKLAKQLMAMIQHHHLAMEGLDAYRSRMDTDDGYAERVKKQKEENQARYKKEAEEVIIPILDNLRFDSEKKEFLSKYAIRGYDQFHYDMTYVNNDDKTEQFVSLDGLNTLIAYTFIKGSQVEKLLAQLFGPVEKEVRNIEVEIIRVSISKDKKKVEPYMFLSLALHDGISKRPIKRVNHIAHVGNTDFELADGCRIHSTPYINLYATLKSLIETRFG